MKTSAAAVSGPIAPTPALRELPAAAVPLRRHSARYRGGLPQLADQIYLTDTGLETDLIFHHHCDLPCFAAFTVLDTVAGRRLLERYYRSHVELAITHRVGFVMDTPTWRANTDWGARLGYGPGELRAANQAAVAFLGNLRHRIEKAGFDPLPMVISGRLGPRADGYVAAAQMGVDEAHAYHAPQIAAFADSEADMVSAMTMTYPAEAIGIVQAATQATMPVAVSFTLEVDGRLPDGTSLAEAVQQVDDATGSAPAYFLLNCAHPEHIEAALRPGESWMHRIRGIRANASRRSHAQLDNAALLDDGDCAELAEQYQTLRARLPQLTVLGGCCGTDLRHLQAIADTCVPHTVGQTQKTGPRHRGRATHT